MFRCFLASLTLMLAGFATAADAPPPAPANAPAAASAAAPVAAPTGRLLDRVVAIVNDGVVTQSELDEQTAMIVERLQEQKTQLPPEEVLRKQVLDRLVIQEVQFQRAARIGLKVSDEQVNSALADIAQRNGIALAQLPAALAQQGIDFAGFRDNIRKEITLQLLRQRDVLSKTSVTPRELEQFIERIKKLHSGAGR
jgi:peptidyl-prolyl cis-trans isomerase SurA